RALTDPVLPDNRTLVVRVESPRHPGFLAGHQKVLSARTGHEHRGLPEVVVRTELFRARKETRFASGEEHVAGEHLARPPYLSGLQIERENRIAGRLRRSGVAVPSPDVQDTALDIDRGGIPHSRAGRPIDILSRRRILSTNGRSIRDRVGLPDDL